MSLELQWQTATVLQHSRGPYQEAGLRFITTNELIVRVDSGCWAGGPWPKFPSLQERLSLRDEAMLDNIRLVSEPTGWPAPAPKDERRGTRERKPSTRLKDH